MKTNSILLILLTLSSNLFSQIANFSVPDTLCVKQSITIQNTSSGGNSFYWNFCSSNLSLTPVGMNIGNQGQLNGPVYSAIAKDGNDYFVFVSNIYDGTLTRLAFGNSLTNIPVATNLGSLGVMGYYIEGIQIKKDDVTGNWYGLIAWGQVDNLVRLDFGNSLNNTPTAINLGNINNLMNFSHTIYTFNEGGNWYSFIGNNGNNTIIRLNFGNSLGNIPSATNLGNIGALSGPVGLYPIQENGIWYMFVVNRTSNSLSRLKFGGSLLNTPTGINIGNIGGSMHLPRSITFLRDCGKMYGFIVNEASNDIVRLTFPNGIESPPASISLGNIANFSFPHHISELFRVGDSLFAFIMNVSNNTISRLCFPSCQNASVPSSNLQNPPSISYNTPGVYTISLVVNEGLPNQSNICKEVVVSELSVPVIVGDTTICIGDTLKLISSSKPSNSYLWTGPNGFSSKSQNVIIPKMNTSNSGKYTLTVGGCSNVSVSRFVSVENSPSFTGNTEVCVGDTLNLMSDFTAGGTYLWTRPNGYTSSSQNLLLPSINFIDAGTYSLSVGGCPNTLNIFVNVLSNPTFSGDTTICEGDPLYLSSISNPGKTYLWTGPNGFISTSQDLIIPAINSTNVGKYTFRMSGCPNEISTIVTTLNRPLITGDTTLCVGDPLNLISVASPDNSYLWTGPNGYTSTSQNLEIPLTNLNHAGKYTLTLSGCATAIADKIVKVVSSPIVNLGNDTIICGGISLKLDAENTDCDFQWNTGANSQSIFIYLPGIYSVKVSNGWCSTIDEILIEECGTDLWFPNVYTPNNDGKNDRFNPVFQGKLNSYKILIFNRWGQQIYESMDAYTGWDGTFEGSQCPDGVYYFLAQYATGTGTSALKQRVKRGSVTILR